METDNQTNQLPIEIDSRWIHMNNVEHEKLEWMKDLPKPSIQRTTDESVFEIYIYIYCFIIIQLKNIFL